MFWENYREAVSPMRYLNAVAKTMPIFLMVLIWGAVGIPILWFAAALVISVGLGIGFGHFMSEKMVRGLLDGNGHYRGHRVPGGVWFFLALGVLGPVAAATILGVLGDTEGWLILHVGGASLGAMCCAVYATIAFVVLGLERTQNKHVCMGGGEFYFDDE
jgi:hypothetical protein